MSVQLFEHLHPDDALVHLLEVNHVLKKGGYYFLDTPNKLAGPGDISRFFTDEPQGFHLKEYDISEMCSLLDKAGFRVAHVLLRRRRLVGQGLAKQMEFLWRLMPKSLRRRHSAGLHNPIFVAQKR